MRQNPPIGNGLGLGPRSLQSEFGPGGHSNGQSNGQSNGHSNGQVGVSSGSHSNGHSNGVARQRQEKQAQREDFQSDGYYGEDESPPSYSRTTGHANVAPSHHDRGGGAPL